MKLAARIPGQAARIQARGTLGIWGLGAAERREYALTALMKLAARFPGQAARIQACGTLGIRG